MSNFDYSPTALAILETGGVRELFAAIVVSDEVGWRKPRPDIFREAFRRTGVDPRRTLFVGDRADIDVVGAQAMGMDVAWINPGHEALPGRHRAAHLRDPRPGRARRHHGLGVDQKRSSRCSSPWYSQNSVAFPFFSRHTWTSGNDADTP